MQNLVWEFISFIPAIEHVAHIWLNSLKESADCDLMFVSLWLMDEVVIARYSLGRDVCIWVSWLTNKLRKDICF